MGVVAANHGLQSRNYVCASPVGLARHQPVLLVHITQPAQHCGHATLRVRHPKGFLHPVGDHFGREVQVRFDNWLYVLKNLENLTDRPAKLQESVFTRLFEQAEIVSFDDEEYSEYERSLKTYRDLKNSFDTVREKGREERRKEGREEGRREGGKEEKITIAEKLKRQHVPPEIISRSTGLGIEGIEKL